MKATVDESIDCMRAADGNVYIEAEIVVRSLRVPFVLSRCKKTTHKGACNKVVSKGHCQAGHSEEVCGSALKMCAYMQFNDAKEDARVHNAYLMPSALATMIGVSTQELLKFRTECR